MKAVILAGGPGLRLRPLTEDRPKVMVPVNGRPIAEHQIRLLRRFGSDEIIFACGYRWEKIKEAFGSSYETVRIDYCVETERLGTGGGLKKAIADFGLRDSNDDVLAINGDLLMDLDFQRMLEWHNTSRPTLTMLVVPYRSPYGVVEIDKLKTVRKFEEKPEFKDVWINGGLYIISPSRIFKYLPEAGNIETETFPKLVKYGEIIAHPHYGFWSSIDSVKDLEAAEKELAAQLS